VKNYGSFVFRRIFKATISSKGTSFGIACGCQKKIDPQRRGNEAISGKDAKIRRDSRETS